MRITWDSALHTLHQQHDCGAACELLVPHSCIWTKCCFGATSPFSHSDPSVTITGCSGLLSKYSFIHALILHICPKSQLIPLWTVYVLSSVWPAPICKNLYSTEESADTGLRLDLIINGEKTHKIYTVHPFAIINFNHFKVYFKAAWVNTHIFTTAPAFKVTWRCHS